VIKLGVTGGIGSGKTSVCKVFNILGIPVFSADAEAKKIMEVDADIILKLNTIVGKNLYTSGTLDRAELAKLIFSNRTMLDEVNSVVHPAVFSLFHKWIKKQSAPYVIMEAAILFESGGAKIVDRIVTVTAPVEERIARVTIRSNITREEVMERINNQMSDGDKIKRSDYVIDNSENAMIIPAVLNIHSDILKLIE
jgi:dephospho-CoA kinase